MEQKHYKINNNVLEAYYWNNENVIRPWGIEFSDDNSFFSLEKGYSHRVEILEEQFELKDDVYNYTMVVRLASGLVRIQGEDIINTDKVLRKIKLVALEDSLLLDFVMRFRFCKELYNTAYINGEIVEHKNTNIYHQYKCTNVELGGEYGNVMLNIKNSESISSLDTYMYARDNVNEWVVHARMLPNVYDRNVIKLCSKWFDTRPLPEWLTNIICKNKKWYDFLKYHNELKPYKNIIARTFNPNAFPLVEIKKSETLEFEVEVLFHE